jgi:hypothetical protein
VIANIDLVTLLVLGLAVYRICRLVIEDAVTEPLREAIWARFKPDGGIGYLITCYWCVGFWTSSLVVLAYIIVPIPTMVASLILALSSIAGITAARVNN